MYRSLKSHDHAVRSGQTGDLRPLEPSFFHPLSAVRAGKVESAGRFDEHIEAHEQPERILFPRVVDESLVNDHRALRGQRVIGLPEEHPLLVQIPVVKNVSHDDHVTCRQGVFEEISWVKA